MSIINKIGVVLSGIYDDNARFKVMNRLGMLNGMPDDEFLKKKYQAVMGKKLDLDNPRTFTEKLQWLKLYNRNPKYTTMVDKYLVKEYVANMIGEEYIIPTLGVWENAYDIDFDKLPNEFVLKCNHNSGLGMCICKDKTQLDIEKTRELLSKGLSQNYYLCGREWPYKDVKRRIIAERYMKDSTFSEELTDYKFFCFDGIVKMMFIATDRQNEKEDTKFDFFDEHFNHLPFIQGHPNATRALNKPANFEKMKELAEILSKDIPHVRVDFYEINGKVYFGELTFFHFSGMEPILPEFWDYKIGEWLHLPDKIIN